MQRHHKSALYFWLIAISSILSAWFITTHHFPYTGLSLAFIAVSTLFYSLKQEKSIFNTVIYISSLLLSFFLIIRANHLLNFLDISAIIFLNCLLISNASEYTFIKLIAIPFEGIQAIFTTPNQFVQMKTTLKKYQEKKLKHLNYTQLFVSIGVTVILLSVILPLLASANPLFDKMVKGLFDSLNLEKIFQSYTFGRILLSIFFFIILSRLASYIVIQKQKDAEDHTPFIKDTILLIPKIAIVIVIFIFTITQLQLYFASPAQLESLGYTYAKRANEAFGQLSIVSIIVFLLLYNGRGKSKLSQLLDYALLVEGLFLTFVGFKSDFDYSYKYGFTQKRLYGFATIFWILGTYMLYTINYIKSLKPTVFIGRFIVLSCTTLLLVNFFNFDYLIYHFRKTVNGKVDYKYLSMLSPDAGYYKDAAVSIENMINKYGKDMNDWPQDEGFSNYRTVIAIQSLQRNYKGKDFRTFNLSEYKAYKSIKDVRFPELTQAFYPTRQDTEVRGRDFRDIISEVESLSETGKNDEALKKAKEASYQAYTKRDQAEAHYWIGYLYYKLQDKLLAESELKLSIKQDSKYVAPYVTLSAIEMDRNNMQKAVELTQKCIELDPQYAECENNMGLALIYLGRKEEGLRHLEKAVSLEPNSYTFRDNLLRMKQAR